MRQRLWRLVILGVWLGLQIYLFTDKFIYIMTSDNLSNARSILGISLALSRASALLINFNSALILLGCCRVTLTWFRGQAFVHKIGLPLDDGIVFHKLVGWTLAVFSTVHVVGHYINYCKMSRHTNQNLSALLFLHNTGLTGHILLITMIVILLTAGVKIVRKKKFEVFYLFHKLFILYFVTLSVHGCFCFVKTDNPQKPCIAPQSWIWITPGLALYLLESIYTFFRARSFAYVSKVLLHQSQVFELQIRKPSFSFTAGQYVLICVPSVSKLQWHPFTVTSAPEDDFIAIHIRVVGDWTRDVAKCFGIRTNENNQLLPLIDPPSKMPRIYLDGPYGAPCQDYSKYEVIVCVGAGIGQTPFSSVLRSIWYGVVHSTDELHLRKIVYVGICRNIQSFEWFHDVLKALEGQDTGGLLDIRYFLTGQLGPSQICSLMHKKSISGGMDQITGLQSPTSFGRPNFDLIIQELSQRYQLCRIGVFFCGPQALAKKVRKSCRKYSDSSTHISFHKEHFDQ